MFWVSQEKVLFSPFNPIFVEKTYPSPEKVFDFIRENKDKSYKWSLDKTKKLHEQDLMDDTFAILAYINMEYLLNAEQKQLMEQFYRLNDVK